MITRNPIITDIDNETYNINKSEFNQIIQGKF